MSADLSLLKTTSAMANYATRRHAVIAKNIANANTPGYRAQGLRSFAEIYENAELSGGDLQKSAMTAKTINAPDTQKPNGNTVSLEDQLLKSTQAVGEHDIALLVYKKTLDLMKLAIGKNI